MINTRALKSQLSFLNFCNGKKRGELFCWNEVLSQATRDLGAAKLKLTMSGEELKGFDKKLKKGQGRKRKTCLLIRKVEAALARTRKTETTLIQLNTEAMEEKKAAERMRDETKHREQLLRKSIQKSHLRSKQLVEETACLRAESSGLDQDLANSQQHEPVTPPNLGGENKQLKETPSNNSSNNRMTHRKQVVLPIRQSDSTATPRDQCSTSGICVTFIIGGGLLVLRWRLVCLVEVVIVTSGTSGSGAFFFGAQCFWY